MVGKVRAGHLTDGRHAPCIFPVPPASPQGGIPDHPPLKIRCAGVAPGHSSAQPCHTACIFSLSCSGKDAAGHFRCPMDRHRPCFSSRGVFFPPTSPTATPEGAVRKCRADLTGCHAACKQLHCYLMARSAVLCADTRRMRAAPLPRSLPLPHCLFPASPCRRETAKGAALHLSVTPPPATHIIRLKGCVAPP